MFRNKNKAYTLVELVLVVTIIGILSGVGVMSYSKSRNKAVSREALANLKLIAAAERIYKMESNSGVYVACATTSVCNSLLKLSLNPTNWSYSVTLNGPNARVSAVGTSSSISGCTYRLDSADFITTTTGYSSKTGSCP